MKLVEILARELGEWPHACKSISQAEDGFLWKKMWFDLNEWMGSGALSSDFQTAVVTQSQWQAERDRMKAMEEISKFSQEQDQLQHSVEPTYEQQLWDRVALDVHTLIFEAVGSKVPVADIADAVAQYADAFMAERAKRVKV